MKYYKTKQLASVLVALPCALFATAPKPQVVHTKPVLHLAHKVPAKLSVGDTPKVNPPIPSNYNYKKLWRSYLKPAPVGHVDLFSGALSAKINLLAIPENDGVALNVTLSMGSSRQHIFHWAIYTGVMNSNSFTEYPVFIAPDGSRHVLYPTGETVGQAGEYISKDHWKADFTKVSFGANQVNIGYLYTGTVYGPDGTQYTVAPADGTSKSPVQSIKSVHGGTTITYSYTQACVNKISASNGYALTIANKSTSDESGDLPTCQIDSISTPEGGKWSFTYSDNELTTLARPDGSVWTFSQSPSQLTVTTPDFYQSTYNFSTSLPPIFDGNITDGTGVMSARPSYKYVSKQVTQQPGMAPQTWTYKYSGDTTTVTGPEDIVTVYTYNNDFDTIYGYSGWRINQTVGPFIGLPQSGYSSKGLMSDALLKKEISQDGKVLQTTNYTWTAKQISTQPSFYCPANAYNTMYYQKIPCQGSGGPNDINTALYRGDIDPNQGIYMPLPNSVVVQQDGNTYTTSYSGYDAYGYPSSIIYSFEDASKKTNSYAVNQTYYENTSAWIFKLADKTTTATDGKTVLEKVTRNFNDSGELTNYTKNGVETKYAYDGSGNLLTKTDALGHETKYADYQNGVPQEITDPMGYKTIIKVSNNGTVTSITDPMSHTTSYTYDSLYRLASIKRPLGNPISITYAYSSGQTEQVVKRGDYQKQSYLNGFEKPIKVIESDGSVSNETDSCYTPYNHLAFQSYPVITGTASSEINGISYVYDGLGRVISKSEPVTMSSVCS